MRFTSSLVVILSLASGNDASSTLWQVGGDVGDVPEDLRRQK